MFFWILNGILVIFLIMTVLHIVSGLREEPMQKGRVVGECVWAGVLVLFLLYNFGFITLP